MTPWSPHSGSEQFVYGPPLFYMTETQSFTHASHSYTYQFSFHLMLAFSLLPVFFLVSPASH